MTREILLHIGAPKAGSTYLQRVLAQNRSRLAASGIAYPGGKGDHPGNARNLRALDHARFEALFTDAPRVVLSHEDLFALDGEGRALAQLARDAGVPVRVLCFLRPWSDFCFADLSQHLKQHLERYILTRRPFDGLSLEEMAARRAQRLDPAGYLLRWVRLFPRVPLVLAAHGGIRATVERLLGQPGLDWSVPRHLANPSLRVEDCEAIAAMIRDGHPAETIRDAMREALRCTDLPDAGRGPARAEAIEALFAEQNRALLDIWGFDNRLAAGHRRPAAAASQSSASCAMV